MKTEKDATTIYADIIDRQYRPSAVHRHMSMKGRAAQFAPFAALHGHSESIDEAARHTDADTELTDESRTDIARRTAEAYDAAFGISDRTRTKSAELSSKVAALSPKSTMSKDG